MAVSALEMRADLLVVTWDDGTAASYPTIWLRDNCPTGLHPQTHERTLDLLTLDDAPQLLSAEIQRDTITLTYADGHISDIPLGLLNAHRPGEPAKDPADIPPHYWRADLMCSGIPRFSGKKIVADDTVLDAWMRETARFGLSIVDDLGDQIDAGVEVAERIGFLRKTNFGTTFEVVSMPDPNNLAYTPIALPLHSDLPNQEVPPGFQFLHCLTNDAQGGGSIFADGFAIAEDMRQQDPEAFRLLCEVPIPYRFHDEDYDIRVREPVITLDHAERLLEIRYNAHIASIFDMPADIMQAYYRAYRAYMRLTRDPRYRLSFKLQSGEMAVFDNRRVLHGREAFDPSTGYRHLHGCYVDRGEFLSRLRVLARGSSA